MKQVEELLEELSSTIESETSSAGSARFNSVELKHLADQRQRRSKQRRTTAVVIIGVAALVGLVSMMLASREQATQLDVVDRSPQPTSEAEPGPDADSDPGEDQNTDPDSDPGDSTQPEPVESKYAIEPEDARQAMVAVEGLLAALAADDMKTAAALWSPTAEWSSEPIPANEQAEIEALRSLCAEGRCVDDIRLTGARGAEAVDGRSRAEVFLQSGDVGTPFTMYAEEAGDDPESPTWRVVSSPRRTAEGEGDVVTHFERLFPSGVPATATLAWPDGIDVVRDGEVTRAYPGPVIDPWIRQGWLFGEDRWIALDGSGLICHRPIPGANDYTTVDLVTIGGRRFIEMLARAEEGSPTEPSVFFDCGTGLIDSSLSALGGRYYGDIDRRLFSTDGESVRYLAVGEGCCRMTDHRILTDDGVEVPLFDGEQDEVDVEGPVIRDLIFDASTETVAYAVHWPDSGGGVVMVRSLLDGEVLLSFPIDGNGILGYDGQYVSHSYAGGLVGPMDGTLHTPAGRIVVHDMVGGNQAEIRVANAKLSLS